MVVKLMTTAACWDMDANVSASFAHAAPKDLFYFCPCCLEEVVAAISILGNFYFRALNSHKPRCVNEKARLMRLRFQECQPRDRPISRRRLSQVTWANSPRGAKTPNQRLPRCKLWPRRSKRRRLRLYTQALWLKLLKHGLL